VSGAQAPAGGPRQVLADGAFLNRRRVVAWSTVLLLVELAFAGVAMLFTHGIVHPQATPLTTDFASFYGAGLLALGDKPQLVYDQAAHYLAEQQATAPGVGYSYFFYPPVFLLLCAPLAKLPYLVAFYVFEGLSLIAYVFVALRVFEPAWRPDRWKLCLPILAFPSVIWSFGIGQNSMLTAALFGGGLLLLERKRPLLGGMLLGALIYKPHFGILLPIAFLAGRQWRAIVGAAVSVLVLAGLSYALFGWQTWHDYLIAFSGSGDVYASGKVTLGGFATVFGGALLIGAPPDVAIAIQAVIGVVVAAIVALVWYRTDELPLRAAVLLAGTLLCVPLALFYDLLLVALAIFFLIRHARAHGFLPGERVAFGLVYLVPMVSRYVGEGVLHLPLGPPAAAAVFAYALVHVHRLRTPAPASPLASPGSFAAHPG
jgi:alpha-1,2-mannosyltransferase